MGSAYSEGIVKYLEEKASETGHRVEKVVHLSPADPSGFTANPNPLTIELKNENDIVLGYKNFGEGDDRIKGVDMYGDVDTDDNFFSDLINSHADTKYNPETFDALRDLEGIKFDFKYTFAPNAMQKFDLYKYSKTKNGTEFNSVFKNGRNFITNNKSHQTSVVRFK